MTAISASEHHVVAVLREALDRGNIRLDRGARIVRVIAPAAGGSIRSYEIRGGALHLRPSTYETRWPAMDAVVSEQVGLPVAPYEIGAGGEVRRVAAPLTSEVRA